MASVITTAFENWKAQEAASGKAVLLDEFVFANVPNLDPTKPIDRNEKLPPANQIVHRQAVNKAGLASENAVAYSVTMGADVGNFDFNWIGLLNKASGTVAMITHAPTQKKLKTQNGQQGNVLTRSFILEFQGAAEETQIKTSAETWQIDFTARLSGIDEMQRLINVDSYGEAAFFNDGFEVTRSGEQYTVKKGLGYVGGLRGELAQNQILNGLRNTKVYADFSYQGNIVSQWNTVVKITSAATLNNYVDTAGFTHQVFAIASIDASGNVKDLRPMGALSYQEIDALKKQLKLDLNGKVDKANITQQKGNSREHVVSQDLFTSEVGKLQGKGDYLKVGQYGWGGIAEDTPAYPLAEFEALIKRRTTVTQVLRNQGESSYCHFKYGAFAYFKSNDTYTALTASYQGSGVKIIAGNQGAFQVYNIWTDANFNPDDYAKNIVINEVISKKFDKDNVSNQTGTDENKVPSLKLFSSEIGKLQVAGNYALKGDSYLKQESDNRLYEKFDKSSITQGSGDSKTKVISQDAVTYLLIGVNDKYTDYTTQRKNSITYTNALSKPILVIVYTDDKVSTGLQLETFVDGNKISRQVIGGDGFTRAISSVFIVPSGSTYSVSTNVGIGGWFELR